MHYRRKTWITILTLILAGLMAGCALLGLEKEEDDNTGLLLLLLGLSNTASCTCSNSSGMVVCVAPGLAQCQ
ncbi:MAG: hypothetical protein H7A21_07510 [Spirochaetales bacterium]|nr:hypothetical protein [Leptospiraceae bacterium]MCP5481260.1 hypothetical protein [Spirochaetales bacterium]MCP5485696.1 hypothetical protein [Spirochaetales bacterium]